MNIIKNANFYAKSFQLSQGNRFFSIQKPLQIPNFPQRSKLFDFEHQQTQEPPQNTQQNQTNKHMNTPSTSHSTWKTASFYRFIDLSKRLPHLKTDLYQQWSQINVCGRVYLASEGKSLTHINKFWTKKPKEI